jgi:hypothetical protein
MVPFDEDEDVDAAAQYEAMRQVEVGAVAVVLALVVALLSANLV